ncbi:MAG: DnaJ domain-containing protein [Prochlorococcaceae cyanobacterium]
MSEDDQRNQAQQRSIQLKLSAELVARLDGLKNEYGLRSRGAIVERLLRNILVPDDGSPDAELGVDASGASHAEVEQRSLFDERGSLVLVAREGNGELVLDVHPGSDPDGTQSLTINARGDQQVSSRGTAGRGKGIDLPGFVRRRSEQVRDSLRVPTPSLVTAVEPLPQMGAELIECALERAGSHWLEVYGTPASAAVLEASMVWLAQDIWPHCDQSEGRPFSWTLIGEVMASLAPAWPPGPPSFERVIVAAGILEDPFSGSTLEMRLPTLIRRFVHRFRRRRPGASFQTLEHTMTLHGALKLLQLPTAPGHRLTLPEIREAYRQLALAHHPDSGGSEDTMRRLNEAYQLLKELYRTP